MPNGVAGAKGEVETFGDHGGVPQSAKDMAVASCCCAAGAVTR